MQENGCGDPARGGAEAERKEKARDGEGGDDSPVRPGQDDPLRAQIGNDTQVIVFEGVPEVSYFPAHQFQPRAEVAGNVSTRLRQPIARDFGALQLFAGCDLGQVDRIAQHLCLSRAHSGKMRIAGRVGIISEPEIYAAVCRQKNRIAGDEVVMDPARRGAGGETEKEKSYT